MDAGPTKVDAGPTKVDVGPTKVDAEPTKVDENNFIPVWNRDIDRFNHNPNIPESFRMLIVGPSNSGKTVLLNKILLTPNYLDYNNLIIFINYRSTRDANYF